MGSFSIWHWLIVLLIVVLIFGTKKLRNIGSDVGGAVKNFKDAMNEEKDNADAVTLNTIKDESSNFIEAESTEIPELKAAPKKRAPAAKSAVKKAVVSKSPTPKPVRPKAAAKPRATTANKIK